MNTNKQQHMNLTQLQQDLIFGTLLGDGCLDTETNGKTWRYRALHKTLHKEYLMHKYDILKPLCNEKTPPAEGQTYDQRTGKTYKRWYFNTVRNDSFKYYANMFYTYNPELVTKRKTGCWVKDVPSDVRQLLTARAVAYWYMDDGAIQSLGTSNAMRVCTESFSLEGLTRLQAALEENFSIVTNTTKVNKRDKETGEFRLVGYRLTISEQYSGPFRDLIKPYLVDCMKYKVSDGNRGHL